jgi:hypothetical protein
MFTELVDNWVSFRTHSTVCSSNGVPFSGNLTGPLDMVDLALSLQKFQPHFYP